MRFKLSQFIISLFMLISTSVVVASPNGSEENLLLPNLNSSPDVLDTTLS